MDGDDAFQISKLLTMDSSDEDFLPDPDRPRKEKKPPDPPAKRGPKRKLEEDITKGKCFFISLSEMLSENISDS